MGDIDRLLDESLRHAKEQVDRNIYFQSPFLSKMKRTVAEAEARRWREAPWWQRAWWTFVRWTAGRAR